MTVIRPNSISGITSITGQGGDISIFRADGTTGDLVVNNVTTGIITATTFVGGHSGNGANLTNLPAGNLTGNLPAISAANLTSIPAANITGTLPAISAANLTNVPAANITGTLPAIDGSALTGVGVGTADSINTSGIITATSFNGQGKFSNLPNKNLFTNGAVNISQRGNSYSSANSYTADQWYLFATGSTTERLTTSPPDGFTYYLRCPSTSNSIIFLFPIELTSQGKIGHLKGKTLTISWYARSESSNTMYAYADFRNAAGGGDFTAVYNGASDVSSLTSSWVRYSRTFTISVTPHSNNKALFIQLRTPSSGSGSTGTLEIAGVQCEFGDTMTDFEHISPADDLTRCERFYHQTQGRMSWMTNVNATDHHKPIQFPVTMRTSPSVSFFSLSVDGSGANPQNVTPNGYACRLQGNGRHASWQHTASAEL